MTAIGSIIRALPRSGSAGEPPMPPLLAAERFDELMDEVIGRRDGLGWRLGGDLPAALAARLADGEQRSDASPLVEALSAVDGEASDTFSGRVAGPPGRTPGERLMQAAAWARAAAELVGAPTHVGILDGEKVWVAESPAGRPLTDIAMDIGWALSVRRFEPITPGMRTDVPAVVALDRRSIQEARHVHRTAGLRGPWLGVCIGNRTRHAPPLEIVSGARHRLGVDDIAAMMRRLHLLADRLLEQEPEGATQAIARDLTRKYGDLWRPRRSWQMPPRTRGREEYVARSIDPSRGDTALPGARDRAAWGLGVALHRFAAEEGWTGPLSPAFRVIHRVGEGPADRRAVLTAVRFEGDRPEPFAQFEARLQDQCARESAGFGLLSEWQRRIARQPLDPRGHARFARALAGFARLDGPAAALTGAAELSWSELPHRRDAPWRVYSGTTPPGSAATDGVALHLHRVGDVVDLVATARGRFAARENATRFLDSVLAAISAS